MWTDAVRGPLGVLSAADLMVSEAHSPLRAALQHPASVPTRTSSFPRLRKPQVCFLALHSAELSPGDIGRVLTSVRIAYREADRSDNRGARSRPGRRGHGLRSEALRVASSRSPPIRRTHSRTPMSSGTARSTRTSSGSPPTSTAVSAVAGSRRTRTTSLARTRALAHVRECVGRSVFEDCLDIAGQVAPDPRRSRSTFARSSGGPTDHPAARRNPPAVEGSPGVPQADRAHGRPTSSRRSGSGDRSRTKSIDIKRRRVIPNHEPRPVLRACQRHHDIDTLDRIATARGMSVLDAETATALHEAYDRDRWHPP